MPDSSKPSYKEPQSMFAETIFCQCCQNYACAILIGSIVALDDNNVIASQPSDIVLPSAVDANSSFSAF